jgi:hypothetical protein
MLNYGIPQKQNMKKICQLWSSSKEQSIIPSTLNIISKTLWLGKVVMLNWIPSLISLG